MGGMLAQHKKGSVVTTQGDCTEKRMKWVQHVYERRHARPTQQLIDIIAELRDVIQKQAAFCRSSKA